MKVNLDLHTRIPYNYNMLIFNLSLYILLLYEAKRKVFWTRVRISPGPPKGDMMNPAYVISGILLLTAILVHVFF